MKININIYADRTGYTWQAGKFSGSHSVIAPMTTLTLLFALLATLASILEDSE